MPDLKVQAEYDHLGMAKILKQPDCESPSRLSVLLANICNVPAVIFNMAENVAFAFVKFPVLKSFDHGRFSSSIHW